MTSDQAATLTLIQGAVVSVPAAAVPVTEAGGMGTMVLRSEPSALSAILPTAFTAIGPVVQSGPVGLTFGRCG